MNIFLDNAEILPRRETIWIWHYQTDNQNSRNVLHLRCLLQSWLRIWLEWYRKTSQIRKDQRCRLFDERNHDLWKKLNDISIH